MRFIHLLWRFPKAPWHDVGSFPGKTLCSQDGPESFHTCRFDGRKWRSRSSRLPSKHVVSVGLDLRRTADSDLLGIGQSTREPWCCRLQLSDQNHLHSWWLNDLLQYLRDHLECQERVQEGPSRSPKAWTWHLSTPPWVPGTAIRTWRVVCWRMSQTSWSVAHPTWKSRVVDSPWPSSTPWSVSGRLWTGNLDVVHSWQMDGKQRNRLAVVAIEQPYGHLHQSVRSRAPLVLDVRHRHCVVAHQSHHSRPQMR